MSVTVNALARGVVVAMMVLASAVATGTAQAQASAAETAIRQMLQRYASALGSLDASAVKKVQPSIQVESLAKTFKDMRDLKVVIDEVRVASIDGTVARVSCRVQQTFTPKVGTRAKTTVNRVIRLRRDADSWVIDGFER